MKFVAYQVIVKLLTFKFSNFRTELAEIVSNLLILTQLSMHILLFQCPLHEATFLSSIPSNIFQAFMIFIHLENLSTMEFQQMHL